MDMKIAIIKARGDFMYTAQPKNMLVMNILEILRKHSDADHRLNQKDIVVEPLSSIIVKLNK